MNVMIDICVIPMNVGISVSPYVVECQKIFDEAGLNHQLHPYGTNVEGDWDEVMAAVKRCHEKMHEMGADRVHSADSSTWLGIGFALRTVRPQLRLVRSIAAGFHDRLEPFEVGDVLFEQC